MSSQLFANLVGIFSCSLSADAYKAATAVHSAILPCNDGSWRCGRDTLQANLRVYDGMAKDAARAGADIIVFPEDGITGLGSGTKYDFYNGGYTDSIPELTAARVVPCTERDNNAAFRWAPSVVHLSCIARQHKIAVVANLIDWDYRNSKLYNTDVAFDNDGTYLAKYHKLNLWGEQSYTDVPTDCPEVTFTTSFNVTFGMLTCADLIHKFPVLDMLAKGVKDFIQPAAWDNSMAQMQVMAWVQGWSLANDVNVVLSNLQWYTQTTCSGSGIWSSGKPLAYHYAPDSRDSAPLVAEIPRPGSGRKLQAVNLSDSWERFNVSKLGYASAWKFTPLSTGKLCTGSICCEANVTKGISAGYVLAAVDGTDSGGGSGWSAQVCAVLPCRGASARCLWYQEPGLDTNLKGLSLHMSGLASESVVPEIIATGEGDHYEKTLPPGVGFESMHFESSDSEARISLTTSTWLSSALVYGRTFTEKLPYDCPSGRNEQVLFYL